MTCRNCGQSWPFDGHEISMTLGCGKEILLCADCRYDLLRDLLHKDYYNTVGEAFEEWLQGEREE